MNGANPLPAEIKVATARLPVTYEAAKAAIAKCSRIDECQDWANKAEALAAYARMADDDALRKQADRIQARAVRRCGELLKSFNSQGQRTDQLPEGSLQKSQEEAATDAGLSEHQTKQAVRTANVPAEEFEAAIESDDPPTVTALADRGKKPRPPPPPGFPIEAPTGFKEATEALGTVYRFADFCREYKPAMVAGGVLVPEVDDARTQVQIIQSWLHDFNVQLGRQA